MNNRRCKPAGTVPPSWQQHHCTALPEAHSGIRPQNSHCLQAFFSWSCSSTNELCFLKPVLAIRPQNYHWSQAWFHQASVQMLWLLLVSGSKQASGLPLAGCRLGSPEQAAVPLDCALWNLCQQSGLRTPTTCRLGSYGSPVAAMAPSSQHHLAGTRVLLLP
jgi:hypothetical protein